MSSLKSAPASALGGKMTNVRAPRVSAQSAAFIPALKPNAAPDPSELSKLIRNSCSQVSGRFCAELFT